MSKTEETKITTTKAKERKPNSSYSKQQIVKSNQYALVEKDVLNALLQDDQQYTREEVAEILHDFMKKEVK